jgi:hypothetical protein
LGLIFSPIFVWALIKGLEKVQIDLIIMPIVAMIGLIWLWSYTVLRAINSQKHIKEIKLVNGVLTFPKSTVTAEMVSINIKDIDSAIILKAPKSSSLILQFVVNGKRYGLTDDSISEKQFSILCNGIVKHSNRCKACQSTQVTWKKDIGHCHNCETITPRNADDFDWSDAYQA